VIGLDFMLFRDVLNSLEKRGLAAKAEALKRQVTEQFDGLCSVEELLGSDMDDVLTALNLGVKMVEAANELQSQMLSVPSSLEAHLAGLRGCGATVVMGKGYEKLCQKSESTGP